MNTRRAFLTTAAAAGALTMAPRAAEARPIVTVWHQLNQRAQRLVRYGLVTSGRAPSRRTLARDVKRLTELVADLTTALQAEHGGSERPGDE